MVQLDSDRSAPSRADVSSDFNITTTHGDKNNSLAEGRKIEKANWCAEMQVYHQDKGDVTHQRNVKMKFNCLSPHKTRRDRRPTTGQHLQQQCKNKRLKQGNAMLTLIEPNDLMQQQQLVGCGLHHHSSQHLTVPSSAARAGKEQEDEKNIRLINIIKELRNYKSQLIRNIEHNKKWSSRKLSTSKPGITSLADKAESDKVKVTMTNRVTAAEGDSRTPRATVHQHPALLARLNNALHQSVVPMCSLPSATVMTSSLPTSSSSSFYEQQARSSLYLPVVATGTKRTFSAAALNAVYHLNQLHQQKQSDLVSKHRSRSPTIDLRHNITVATVSPTTRSYAVAAEQVTCDFSQTGVCHQMLDTSRCQSELLPQVSSSSALRARQNGNWVHQQQQKPNWASVTSSHSSADDVTCCGVLDLSRASSVQTSSPCFATSCDVISSFTSASLESGECAPVNLSKRGALQSLVTW